MAAQYGHGCRSASGGTAVHCLRLTRLTNAFSKKFENFEAAVALNFCYYNFCKTQGALKMTPAMAAGIESSHWTVEDLVKRCYGWTYGESEESITILELPPVDSPQSAVTVGVAYQIKKARK